MTKAPRKLFQTDRVAMTHSWQIHARRRLKRAPAWNPASRL